MGRKFSIHLVCCLSGALGAGACRCTLVPCPEPSRRQEGMETQLPEEPHQVVYQYLGRHLPRDDSRAKGSLCTSINPWPTCPLEARMGPFSLTLPLTHSSLSHRAPSPEHTGHWALGAPHGKAFAVSSTSRPLYSNFRTHFTVPRFSPALQTRQTRAVRTSSPQRSFQAPEHATRLRDENLAGLFHLTHASAATDQGAGRHLLSQPTSPAPVLSDAPLQVISTRRSSTPLPPFGIGPPNTSTLPL